MKVEVEKVERSKEARFIIKTPLSEKLFSDESGPPSFQALSLLLEDIAEEFDPITVHMFPYQHGELAVFLENVNTVVYHTASQSTTAFGTPYEDFQIVQLFRVGKHYYLAHDYKLYAFGENELRKKLEELGLPLITP